MTYMEGIPVMAYRIADCMLAARAPDPREEDDDDGR